VSSSAGTNKKKQENKNETGQARVETIFYYEYPSDEGLYDKLERIVSSPALYGNLLNKTIGGGRSSNLVDN
jgi:hypothetical protein